MAISFTIFVDVNIRKNFFQFLYVHWHKNFSDNSKRDLKLGSHKRRYVLLNGRLKRIIIKHQQKQKMYYTFTSVCMHNGTSHLHKFAYSVAHYAFQFVHKVLLQLISQYSYVVQYTVNCCHVTANSNTTYFEMMWHATDCQDSHWYDNNSAVIKRCEWQYYFVCGNQRYSAYYFKWKIKKLNTNRCKILPNCRKKQVSSWPVLYIFLQFKYD